MRKAQGAITNYGVHLVVANELHSRKDTVLLVAPPQGGLGPQGVEVRRIDRPAGVAAIESLLVAEVVAMHAAHMERAEAAEGQQ